MKAYAGQDYSLAELYSKAVKNREQAQCYYAFALDNPKKNMKTYADIDNRIFKPAYPGASCSMPKASPQTKHLELTAGK